MKDYAAMTVTERTAYNEGLLDAIDRLDICSRAHANDAILAAAYRVGASEVMVLRTEQIASAQ